jgi:hypothetical protein
MQYEINFIKIYSKLLESGDEELYIYELKDYIDKYLEKFISIDQIDKYLFYLNDIDYLLSFKVTALYYVTSQMINKINEISERKNTYIKHIKNTFEKLLRYRHILDSYEKIDIFSNINEEIITSQQDKKYNKVLNNIDTDILRIEIINRLLSLKKTFGNKMLRVLKFSFVTYDDIKIMRNCDIIMYYNENIKKISKYLNKYIDKCTALLEIISVINTTILTFDITIPLKNYNLVIE